MNTECYIRDHCLSKVELTSLTGTGLKFPQNIFTLTPFMIILYKPTTKTARVV